TAIAVGIDPDREPPVQRWREMMRNRKLVPMQEVDSGAALENVLSGDAVNLFKFPVPKWHENDGGRYIGTGVCVINRDPDSGFVNSGAYRVAIADERTCTLFVEHGKHGYRIAQKYWRDGKKCPVVISVGQEPVMTALAAPSIFHTPDGVSEFEVAGYIQGSPYPVICGQATGLPIPANAEIALEGFICSPEERLIPEGPFGEWTGYYAHGRRPEFAVEIATVYHRNEPILFGLPPTRPLGCYPNPTLGDDDIDSLELLDQAGIPGIQRVYFLGRPNLRVVSLKQMHPGHVDDVIRVLAPGGEQYSGHHIWMLVDEDINVESPEEVLWALAGRCAPETGVTVVPGTAVWALDPRVPPDKRVQPDTVGRPSYTAHNLVINACRPYEWRDDFPRVSVNSPALRERTLDKWKHLFEETKP
ncbi:MAG TPA: UbiD family decarboxylase, partial [Chloroflexota bacterium]|nr:UbiD family decarboxylase [Chloroflexota bacterium]